MKKSWVTTRFRDLHPPAAEVAAPGNATVYRDVFGTPHVYADKEEDGFFALGYVWSEDRLLQLLFQYLQASGNLAAKFGPGLLDPATLSPELAGYPGAGVVPDTVASDLNMRRYRYLEDARANFSRLSAQVQADITAFFEGMEKYMAENPSKVPAWAPDLEPALMLAGSHFHDQIRNEGVPGGH
jgi:acyl-homoserine-lactone acylase